MSGLMNKAKGMMNSSSDGGNSDPNATSGGTGGSKTDPNATGGQQQGGAGGGQDSSVNNSACPLAIPLSLPTTHLRLRKVSSATVLTRLSRSEINQEMTAKGVPASADQKIDGVVDSHIPKA